MQTVYPKSGRVQTAKEFVENTKGVATRIPEIYTTFVKVKKAKL